MHDRKTLALSAKILHAYYPEVSSLQDYLRQILDSRTIRSVLIHETDTRQYRDLVETTMVTLNELLRPLDIKPVKPLGPLRELVERVQIKHLKYKSPQSNVLTLGYQLRANVRNNNVGTSGAAMLQSRYVNTVVTAFESPAWETLHERVGDDIMFHLLADTSIYISLPNACYCQLTGIPIVDLIPPASLSPSDATVVDTGETDLRSSTKRKHSGSNTSGNPTKRRRLDENGAQTRASAHTSGNVVKRQSPADITLSRTRLFYFRPSGQGETAHGLPASHILNRLIVDHKLAFVDSAASERKQQDNARHLAKYVFPRQYGLASAFDSIDAKAVSSSPLVDFKMREGEIKSKGSMKTPHRVKHAVHLLEKLVWRHSKCGYRPLLSRVCPSKVKSNIKNSLDSSIILEMMSETSMQLHSQAEPIDSSVWYSSAGVPGSSQIRATTKQQAQQKPRFAEFMCSYSEVFRYAVVVTKTVIPMQFWGSKRNFKVIKRHVKTLITMRRFETLSLHTLLQNFVVSDCDWLLAASSNASKTNKTPVSDSLKRLELLQEFLYWYFDSFLISLLKTSFYVTESQAFRNKVLYFRQDDWEILCRPLIEKLCSNTFQKLRQNDAEEILRQRNLGYSFVRLLPKETGVRPIINLRRRETAMPYKRSINQILKAAFHILTYEKDCQRKLVGASSFGPNETYQRLKAFKATLQRDFPDELPQLYFVKMDVQACFDTIDQTKLLQILLQVLKEDSYVIERHGQVSSQCSRIKRNFVSTAYPSDDYPDFLAVAAQLASALRNTIFVDKVVYPDAKRGEMIQLLEQHITDNIVKIGNDYYRQVVGIPQGSILSTLLCSFFYGDLERTKLKFTEDPHTVLLRLVDDYLLVTTNRKRARLFYDVMNKGHPEYGCFISQDKTLTNFDDRDMFNVIDPSQGGFPWCGFSIDMKDLSVSTDYTRWSASTLRDSFTINFGRRPGAAFAQKMLTLARSKSHMIYNDCRLNSVRGVYKNIYQSFCIAAMKMHYYIRSWKPDMDRSAHFIASTVRQVIRYSYAAMKSRSTSRLSKRYGAKLEAQKGPVIWLGTHAFHTVLARKSHEYACILRSLEFDMSLPQYARHRKQLRGIVKEGRDLFAMLEF